jgi:hypothetical protein
MRRTSIFVGAAAIAITALWASGIGTIGGRAAADTGPPAPPASSHFRARVTNEWFPLTPGARYVYIGVKDAKAARDVVVVTHQTRTIAGVPCVTVRDRLYLNGVLAERTTDWYSQDDRGNVWYFGEETAELSPQGRVLNTDGSWTAGVGGARPGVYITAQPTIGPAYLQEYYKGHAEDHFKAIALLGTVAHPQVKTTLVTEEWTPLEPAVIDHKFYVRGTGTILEQTERGGDERLELRSLTRGS